MTASLLLHACASDDDGRGNSEGLGDGDGDGDPTTGDGDGDPTTGDGDGDGDPTTGDGDGDPVCPGGASGFVADNHGHALVIPQADVAAGVQKVYNIMGNANHGHQVTLTPADFTALANGFEVVKLSSFLMAHDHEVFITCL